MLIFAKATPARVVDKLNVSTLHFPGRQGPQDRFESLTGFDVNPNEEETPSTY